MRARGRKGGECVFDERGEASRENSFSTRKAFLAPSKEKWLACAIALELSSRPVLPPFDAFWLEKRLKKSESSRLCLKSAV